MPERLWRIAALALLLAGPPGTAWPEPAAGREPASDPFGSIPYYLRPGPPSIEPEPEPPKLTISTAFDFPLRTTAVAASGSRQQGSPPTSPTLQAGLRYTPRENWFFTLNFYKYLMQDRQQPWNPDFTYSFGYDNWRPGTWSLIYGNYTGNRLPGQPAPAWSRVEQGQLSLSYRFQPPASWQPWMLAHPADTVSCSTGANLTPRYTDLASNAIRRNKTSLALGCRYSTPGNFFFSLNALLYPQQEQQQPWDPDFVYGFGWFNWRPGSINVQYFNYSGNRFPWRDPARGQGQFRNGSITISWSGAW